MILWLWLPFISPAVAVECPNHDLYAYKLDAYSIEVEDEIVHFKLSIDEHEVIEPDVRLWIGLLEACAATQTLQTFIQWQSSWVQLSDLGLEYQSASWIHKRYLKREIRHVERLIVIQYAQMLHRLELEVGISVLWNVEAHPFAKGMVSAGRGSPKVYRYIYNQFDFVQ